MKLNKKHNNGVLEIIWNDETRETLARFGSAFGLDVQQVLYSLVGPRWTDYLAPDGETLIDSGKPGKTGDFDPFPVFWASIRRSRGRRIKTAPAQSCTRRGVFPKPV